MRLATTVLVAILSLTTATALSLRAPAQAKPSNILEFASTEGVLRWINNYRAKPEPSAVPAAIKSLSGLGAFKDPEQAGPYVGFLAGVIRSNPDKAEDLIAKMLPLPAGDQWVVVRAIAYSEHPDWRNLLRRFADRMPARKVMIDKFLLGQLPRLWQIAPDKPTTWDKVRSYVTLEKLRGAEPPKEVALEPSPELLDTYWGYFFATGVHRPILRILTMLPMSNDHDNIERLTLGSMAKYSLAANASRDVHLLAMLKDARQYNAKAVNKVLDEVIEAAETVETARLRKDAMAALDELKRKGPESRRTTTWWGQLGQGALAAGCIAAAATGHIELGLPCVIGGGVSSAALGFWEKQN
jgi:hypothetical protein